MEILFKDYIKMTRDEIVTNLLEYSDIKVIKGDDLYLIRNLGNLKEKRNEEFLHLLERPSSIENLRSLNNSIDRKVFLVSKKADYGKKLAKNYIVVKVFKKEKLNSIDF